MVRDAWGDSPPKWKPKKRPNGEGAPKMTAQQNLHPALPRIVLEGKKMTWMELMKQIHPFRDGKSGEAVGVIMHRCLIEKCPARYMVFNANFVADMIGIRPRFPGSAIVDCHFVKDPKDNKPPNAQPTITLTAPRA